MAKAKKSKKVSKKAKAVRTAAPKEAKTKKAVRTKEKKAKVKPVYKPTTTLIPKEMLSAEAKKLIKECDGFEQAAADAKDNLELSLQKLVKALGGGKSFEHPERGPFSIMQRGYWFWRKKPTGVTA